MAEITKITSPLIPRENIGTKNRPLSEQSFEVNSPARVNKPDHDKALTDRHKGGQTHWDNLGRVAIQPLLRNSGDLMLQIQKMITLLQLGISTSDIMMSDNARVLMQQIFTSPDELLSNLLQQDEASVLFKGDTFNVLRDVLSRFPDNPKIRESIVNLIKTFEFNVNTQNSIKTILYNCENLLDYMFTRDREQFSSYLDGLAEMLLPSKQVEEDPEVITNTVVTTKEEKSTEQAKPTEQTKPSTQTTVNQQDVKPELAAKVSQDPLLQLTLQDPAIAKILLDAQGNPVLDAQGNPVKELVDSTINESPPLSHKELAQVLKGNLLPLLGEVVVKYHQNARIRDIVMVVVHNIVRVDKGSLEALKEAADILTLELRKVASLPQNYERLLLQSIQENADLSKNQHNEVLNKLVNVISEVLHNPDTNSPASVRQAENLLLSMLQNQSSLMELLHFVLPMQTDDDRLFAELYVDPDSDEYKGKSGENARKFFLTVNSENHGMIEISFLQYGERIELSMWCPDPLVSALGSMKRTASNIMQAHGYTMTAFQVEKLVMPKTVAQIFPRLLERKVGIDVRV